MKLILIAKFIYNYIEVININYIFFILIYGYQIYFSFKKKDNIFSKF